MGTRSAILLAAGACAAGILAILLVTRTGSAHDPGSILVADPTASRSATTETTRNDSPPLLEALEVPATDRAVDRAEPPEAAAASDSIRSLLALPEGTVAEMVAKRESIRGALESRSQPILLERLEAGLGERVTDSERLSAAESDAREICAFRKAPGQGWYKVALDRKEHPELYELKDAEVRLSAWIDDARVREELAKRKP